MDHFIPFHKLEFINIPHFTILAISNLNFMDLLIGKM